MGGALASSDPFSPLQQPFLQQSQHGLPALQLAHSAQTPLASAFSSHGSLATITRGVTNTIRCSTSFETAVFLNKRLMYGILDRHGTPLSQRHSRSIIPPSTSMVPPSGMQNLPPTLSVLNFG